MLFAYIFIKLFSYEIKTPNAQIVQEEKQASHEIARPDQSSKYGFGTAFTLLVGQKHRIATIVDTILQI